MNRPRAVAAALLPLLLVSAVAGAQPSPQPRALRWDPALDVAMTAVGVGAWLAGELFKRDLAPVRCRWCDADAADAGVRGALLWQDPPLADGLSDATGFLLTPIASLGLTALAAAHDRAAGNAGEDTVLVVEAWGVAAGVTEVTKMLVGRERPFVHALPEDKKGQTAQPADNNLSFFSGHTSGAFALAAAAGTVSSMRGYRFAPLVWAASGLLAASTAYLRIAADKHWLTDVVAGALIGGGIGFALPLLLHGPVGDPAPARVDSLRAPVPPLGTAVTLGW